MIAARQNGIEVAEGRPIAVGGDAAELGESSQGLLDDPSVGSEPLATLEPLAAGAVLDAMAGQRLTAGAMV